MLSKTHYVNRIDGAKEIDTACIGDYNMVSFMKENRYYGSDNRNNRYKRAGA